MIIHAVIFTWNDGVGPAEVAAVTAALDDMRPTVTGLVSLERGPAVPSLERRWGGHVRADA